MLVRIIIALGTLGVLLFVRPDVRVPAHVIYRELLAMRASLLEMLFALAQISLFVLLLAYVAWPILRDAPRFVRHRPPSRRNRALERRHKAVADRPSPMAQPGLGD